MKAKTHLGLHYPSRYTACMRGPGLPITYSPNLVTCKHCLRIQEWRNKQISKYAMPVTP